MSQEKALSQAHAAHLEPQDEFWDEDWQGAEIYKGEDYLEMENGDRVINEPENLIEYMREKGTKKVAGD